jgi:hypothetical protein
LLPAALSRGEARAVTLAGAHPVIRTRLPACGHPRGRLWRSLYPNPIRSDTSRRETATTSGGDSDAARRCSRRSHAFPCGRASSPWNHDPTTPAPPPRRVGANGPGAPHERVTLARGRAAHGAAPCGLRARLDSGPRAASPALPRRRARSAAPEVPSIDETGHRHPDARPHRARIRTTGGRDEPYLYPGMVLSTGCCQPGDNPRRLFQSRCIHRP